MLYLRLKKLVVLLFKGFVFNIFLYNNKLIKVKRVRNNKMKEQNNFYYINKSFYQYTFKRYEKFKTKLNII